MDITERKTPVTLLFNVLNDWWASGRVLHPDIY
jgi:hypothetical protein